MKARRFEQETSGRHGTFHLSLKPSTSVIAPTSIDIHLRPRRRRKVVDFIQTHFVVGAFASPHGSVRQLISRDEWRSGAERQCPTLAQVTAMPV